MEKITTSHREARQKISTDRQRTNLFRRPEQWLIAYLVQRIPTCVTSNMLSGIGTFGSALICISLAMARFLHPAYLLLGILGFAINWFGDSLDGRIAYYRNKPRKWFGFALDISLDFIGILIMGFGFVLFADTVIFKLFGFLLMIMYGWQIILTLIKYRITDKYSIDFWIFSPTEMRILISIFFVAEIFWAGALLYFVAVSTCILFVFNLISLIEIVALGDERDIREKAKKH